MARRGQINVGTLENTGRHQTIDDHLIADTLCGLRLTHVDRFANSFEGILFPPKIYIGARAFACLTALFVDPPQALDRMVWIGMKAAGFVDACDADGHGFSHLHFR
jgi:hypothetical protein